jgi:hypothetical protein
VTKKIFFDPDLKLLETERTEYRETRKRGGRDKKTFK